MHTVLNGKKMPKRSLVRKSEAKDGFTPLTQPAINKQIKGDLRKFFFENNWKYVGQCREKYSVEKLFFRKLASKDFFVPPNSIKQMISKFKHSQKWLLKTKNWSASNAGKLASENKFASQKQLEKDVSTYLAKILMQSLEELKYRTRKQVMFTEQSQTGNHFLKKSFFLKFSSQ